MKFFMEVHHILCSEKHSLSLSLREWNRINKTLWNFVIFIIRLIIISYRSKILSKMWFENLYANSLFLIRIIKLSICSFLLWHEFIYRIKNNLTMKSNWLIHYDHGLIWDERDSIVHRLSRCSLQVQINPTEP